MALSQSMAAPIRLGASIESTGTRKVRVPVSPFFWIALLVMLLGAVSERVAGQAVPIYAAVILMLVGGLPHGAYDVAIARYALDLGRARALLVLVAYVGIALTMTALWSIAPMVALSAFLLFAAVHFGEDWMMLEDGLLRVMAGASIICVPAFFRGADVLVLFSTMAGPSSDILLQLAIACTPVALLVTAVGTALAWRAGHREWAAAQTIALIILATTPPQIGFMLYFVFLHSPLHMSAIDKALPNWSRKKTWAYGAGICAITLAAAFLIAPGFLSGNITALSADSFRLLAVVAAPHLLLTAIMKQLTKPFA